MCGVFIVTSVHKLSEWCVEFVWKHLHTSYQNYVRSLYGDIFTPVVRLMCGVFMEASLHEMSDWCVQNVWKYLYTICQTDVWSLYGDTSEHKISDWCLMSVLTHLYNSSPMVGVCMETSVHEMSDWCEETVWTHLYTRYQTEVWKMNGNICPSYQTDVWSLYGHIITPVVRLMCIVYIVTTVLQISDWCVDSVYRYLYTRYQTDA
jgi:hypothetical protein